MTQDVQRAALAWHDAGYCVLPAAADGTKRPGVGSWTRYQSEQYPREALAAGGTAGIGLVCGVVSGGLEMLELEGRAVAEGAVDTISAVAAAAGLGDLWHRVTRDAGAYLEHTPSGGLHILYRLADGPVPGNTKLASRPARDDELTDDERVQVAKGRTVARVLAETRGEGGYVVVAPSGGTTHPTGRPWTHIVGRPGQVPTIAAAEREQLHELFRQLDQMPANRGDIPTVTPERPAGAGLSPGDDFAARTDWPGILEPAGWREHYSAEGVTYWTRPGKDTGTSATTNHDGSDRLKVHTTSTEFETVPETYSKFGAWAVLHHGGDHSAAARDLAARGYGSGSPVGQRPTPADKETLPAPSDPMAVARVLEPDLKAGGAYTLWNWRGGWWRWHTSHWAEAEDLAVKKGLYARTEHAWYTVMTKDGPEDKKWSPTKPKVANLADALAGIVHLDRETRVPSWLGGDPGRGTIVACRNGLLKLDGRELLPHDARYFNLVAVPFDYDPAAAEPAAWVTFLETLWPGGGSGQVDALQEWFGYVISGRTDLQKIFAVIGPPRSGKGTIAAVLTELAGDANVAGPTLASLATNFGIQPLLGKSLALISDARIGRSADTSVIVERLLTISGEDTISVDRKHVAAWEGRIPARIMLLSNELPRFSDSSGTIATRFVVTETTVSFLGREDRTLRARLMAELPGILNWALAGLERLLDRGHFTETEVSTDAVQVMRQTASPFAPFVDDECLVGPQYTVSVDRMWQAWQTWCVRNGRERVGVKQWLGRDLKPFAPGLNVSQPRDPDTRKQQRVYRGIGLAVDYPAAAQADNSGPWTQNGHADTRRHAHIPIAHEGKPEDQQQVDTYIESNGYMRVSARVSPPGAAEQSTPTPTDPNHCPVCRRAVSALAWQPCDRCGERHHARGRGAHGPTCQTCLTERNTA